MTTFILHGGFAKGVKQQDDAFFREMLESAPADVKLLLVYFAEPDEKVQLRNQQDREEFDRVRGSKTIQFRVASEAAFEADCAWADVIYLHGGKTVKLMEALAKCPNIAQLFSGKTVAGDSAGAHALGKLFYSRNSQTIGKGLGILPFKIMAHYADGEPNPFGDAEQGAETLLLREYETKVISV